MYVFVLEFQVTTILWKSRKRCQDNKLLNCTVKKILITENDLLLLTILIPWKFQSLCGTLHLYLVLYLFPTLIHIKITQMCSCLPHETGCPWKNNFKFMLGSSCKTKGQSRLDGLVDIQVSTINIKLALYFSI